MDKKLFRFLDWPVYNDAQAFFKKISEVIKHLPSHERYFLGNQLSRSSLSIVLNIAEGSGRGTDKELNRFFNIAIGSVNESLAAIDALKRQGHIDQREFENLSDSLESISRQLGGFKKKL